VIRLCLLVRLVESLYTNLSTIDVNMKEHSSYNGYYEKDYTIGNCYIQDYYSFVFDY